MMNQPSNQTGADAGLEARLRTMRILWVVFLITIGLYALMCVFTLPPVNAAEEDANNTTLLTALASFAVASVAASFLLKGRIYAQAARQSDPAKFQTGFIIAEVFCEVAALFGLVGLFVTHNRYAYALFVLGALGQLLHFPRRDQLAAAYTKKLW